MSVKRAEAWFHQCVTDWHRADMRCGAAYAAWSIACKERERLAARKNSAWDDLEVERRMATKRKQKR